MSSFLILFCSEIMSRRKADKKEKSKTDWPRIKAMKDEDIDYSDIPQLDANFFLKCRDMEFDIGSN